MAGSWRSHIGVGPNDVYYISWRASAHDLVRGHSFFMRGLYGWANSVSSQFKIKQKKNYHKNIKQNK